MTIITVGGDDQIDNEKNNCSPHIDFNSGNAQIQSWYANSIILHFCQWYSRC